MVEVLSTNKILSNFSSSLSLSLSCTSNSKERGGGLVETRECALPSSRRRNVDFFFFFLTPPPCREGAAKFPTTTTTTASTASTAKHYNARTIKDCRGRKKNFSCRILKRGHVEHTFEKKNMWSWRYNNGENLSDLRARYTTIKSAHNNSSAHQPTPPPPLPLLGRKLYARSKNSHR